MIIKRKGCVVVSVARNIITDTVRSLNSDLQVYGELPGVKHSKISRNFWGDSFRARRERAAIIRTNRAINNETRKADYYSIDFSSAENGLMYKNEEYTITTHFEKLKSALGGEANLRPDIDLVISKIESERHELARLMRDARELKNDYIRLKNMLKQKYLTDRPVMHLTREKLERLKELEKKYFKDSPLDYEQIELFISKNEELFNKIEIRIGQVESMRDMIDRLNRQYGEERTIELSREVYNRVNRNRAYDTRAIG
jgi:hypothetical protein